MALDAGIFAALGTRPRSAFDYLQEMAAQDQLANQNQLQRLQVLGQRRAFDDAEQARQIRSRGMAAVQALGGGASIDQRIKAAEDVGDYGTADSMRKMYQAQRESDAKVAKEAAETGKAQTANMADRLKLYRASLDYIDTPDGAARWLAAQYQDPATAEHMASMIPLEQAVQRIPKDPQQFAMWRQQNAMGMEKFMDQQRQAEAQRESVRHNKAQEGLTARGQNLADARAREANDINKQAGRSQVVETPDGVMIVDKGTGMARPAATMDGKQLPVKQSESIKKELMGIGQQRSVVQGAIDAVSSTPDAFGLARGVATMSGPLAESVAGRFDSDAQRQARSYVFNNVSKVINERAGAAQSAQELARLRSFLPAETDNADQIISKLKAYQGYLNDLESGTKGASRQAPPQAAKFTGWKIEKAD